jgi:hypothetical protein
MPFSDQIEQLEERIGSRVGRAVREFRDEVRRRIDDGQREILQHLEEASTTLPASFLSPDELAPLADRARADGRAAGFADLAASFAALDGGRTQVELLGALLAEGAKYASRTALFLTRSAGVQVWGAHGWGESERALLGVTLAYDDDAWRRLAAGTGVVALRSGDCAALCSRIESPVPYDGVLVPLVLRDRVAAALYADRMEAGQPLAVEALQLLTYAAALHVETLPFRERRRTPTLVAAGVAGAEGAEGLPLWDGPATTAEPRPESAPGAGPGANAADAANAAEVAGAEPEEPAAADVDSPLPVAAEPEPESEPEVAEADLDRQSGPPAEPAVGDVEFEEELVAAPPDADEPAAIPPAAPAAPPEPPASDEPVAAPTTATEIAEPATTGAYLLADVPEPRDTVLLDRSSFAAERAAEATEPPAEPVEEETQAGGPRAPERGAAGADRTTLVPPPTDFQGPGWAFSTTKLPVEADDTTRHEEAHRLARLLVSEIRLYNEDLVEEGRRNHDIYNRLRDDIERSRQIYEERVDDRVRESTDYFQLELVRILAGGDDAALGG